jgi:hypothetical protein
MMDRLRNARCGDPFGGSDRARTAASDADYSYLPLGGPQQFDGQWRVVAAATIPDSIPQRVIINSQGPFAQPPLLTPAGRSRSPF